MKRGFTLIELLAVIVILAIIAVIAVPIVLNIIEDSKNSARLRSADFYLDAVEQSMVQATLKNKNISDGTYNILQSGNICLSYDADNKCIDELIVEANGEIPNSGTITIEKGKIEDISITLNDKTIVKNNKGELVYQTEKIIVPGKLNSVCTPDSEQKYATNPYDEGYKYKCKVDPNQPAYTFYVYRAYNAAGWVIHSASTDKKVASVALIMDRNINSDGTPVKKLILESDKDINGGIYNSVAWINQRDYELAGGKNWGAHYDENTFGPITAIKFLHKATKNWTNILPLNYKYNHGVATINDTNYSGYISFVSTNGVVVITPAFGDGVTIGSEIEPLRARLIESSGTTVCDFGEEYLCDYLDGSTFTGEGTHPTNNMDGITGYWSLGTLEYDSFYSYCTRYYSGGGGTPFGVVDPYFSWYSSFVPGSENYGVRPVIYLNL